VRGGGAATGAGRGRAGEAGHGHGRSCCNKMQPRETQGYAQSCMWETFHVNRTVVCLQEKPTGQI